MVCFPDGRKIPPPIVVCPADFVCAAVGRVSTSRDEQACAFDSLACIEAGTSHAAGSVVGVGTADGRSTTAIGIRRR
jgi:hypothetical protein